MSLQLLEKYNIPAPRYTSYPTVPFWQPDPPTGSEWAERVRRAFEAEPRVSLYIHLPFCERLCTYCGCNKRITRNHGVESPYIQSLLQEWRLYLDLLPGRPLLGELHLGGGTPTFFAPENLAALMDGLLQGAEVAPDADFSFEAHPANTTLEHLQTLYDKGFRRLSIGVQDFNPGILTLINRRQTRQDVFRVVEQARSIGYRSINFDLIFGLPRQRPLDIEFNTEQVALLKPERIAFYSYAHVPWVKPSQRAYSEADLPTACQKRALYELGKQRLEAIGYREIGLDHFALPDDELFRARQHGTLHRNFMGYTPRPSRLLIGLGASSIGDTWDAYAQNEKHVEAYQQRVAAGELPLVKGHLLSPEEQIIRRHILNLMCLFQTSWQDPSLRPPNLERVLQRLEEPARDGLLLLEENGLRITPEGRPFVRNICLAFDFHFWEKRPQEQLFSKVV